MNPGVALGDVRNHVGVQHAVKPRAAVGLVAALHAVGVAPLVERRDKPLVEDLHQGLGEVEPGTAGLFPQRIADLKVLIAENEGKIRDQRVAAAFLELFGQVVGPLAPDNSMLSQNIARKYTPIFPPSSGPSVSETRWRYLSTAARLKWSRTGPSA